jgi:hypothetical protein
MSASSSEEASSATDVSSDLFLPPPISTVLTSTLMYAEDLRSLTVGYVNALPQSLRQYISFDPLGDTSNAPSNSMMERFVSYYTAHIQLNQHLLPCSSALQRRPRTLPLWATQSQTAHNHSLRSRQSEGFSSKSVFYQRDMLNLKAVALSRSPPFNKRLYVEIFESLPAMHHERDNTVAESYSDNEEPSVESAAAADFLQDGHGSLTHFAAPATKQALLDCTLTLKKLREEILLGGETTAERLEDLFFQHDSSLFRYASSHTGASNTAGSAPVTSNASSTSTSTNSTSSTGSTNSTSTTSAVDKKPSATSSRDFLSARGNPRLQSAALLLSKHGASGTNSTISSTGSSSNAAPKGQESADSPSDVANAHSGNSNPSNTSTGGLVDDSAAGATASAAPSPAAMQRSKLSSRNFVARNQVARNLQTKIALVKGAGGKGPPGTADSSSTKKTQMEYLQEYCKHYGINPFKQKEGRRYLSIMSHNRRRWSHVFPLGKCFNAHRDFANQSALFRQVAVPGLWTELEESDPARHPAPEHGLSARGRGLEGQVHRAPVQHPVHEGRQPLRHPGGRAAGARLPETHPGVHPASSCT